MWVSVVRRSLVSALIVGLLLSNVPMLAPTVRAQADLFSPATQQLDSPTVQQPTVIRSRPVVINFPALEATPSSTTTPSGSQSILLLNLFPDVALTAATT